MKKLPIIGLILLTSFVSSDDGNKGIAIKLIDSISKYPVGCMLEGDVIYSSSSSGVLRVDASVVGKDTGRYELKFSDLLSNGMYYIPPELTGSKTLKEFSVLSETYELRRKPNRNIHFPLPPKDVGIDGSFK